MAGPVIAAGPRGPGKVAGVLAGAQRLFPHGMLVSLSASTADGVGPAQRPLAADVGDYLYDLDRSLVELDSRCAAVIEGFLAADRELADVFPPQPSTGAVR